MTESGWGDISLGKRSFTITDTAEPLPDFYKVSASEWKKSLLLISRVPPDFYKVSESPTYRQMINQVFIKFHTARNSTHCMCVQTTVGL